MSRTVPSLKFGAIALCVALLLVLLACSGGSSPSSQSTSGLPQRAFVSNTEAGNLQIIDSIHDVLDVGHTINVGSGPGLMAVSPSGAFTLVFNTLGNSVSVVSNAQESQTTTIALPSWTESLTISPDSKLGYAAMPAATVLGKPAGIVDVLDLVSDKVKYSLNIPQAHWLVLNHSGNRLLVFSDNSNSVTVINPTQIAAGSFSTTVTGFDRPVWAVFSEDDSTAYVLSCGPECGGSNAGLTVLNMNTNTAGATVGLSGATRAMLINGNVYVAGSGHGVGTLQAVNTAGLTASPPIGISNGYHWRMELGSQSKLFIGSRRCSARCLSIVDISKNQAVIGTPNGDVTGIAPIPGRNIVYVIVGGELSIFDTTTSAISTNNVGIDIVGQASDVKEIDPAQ